jgi:hypothetical protein
MGTSAKPEFQTADQMNEQRKTFPFDFVIALGDNLYGGNSPTDFEKKFAAPYKALLDAGVKFYAALGNHDDASERFYKPFNMNGASYYSFKKGNVHFFALDSNYMDPKQLDWLQKQLQSADSTEWKICFFHHPLYSSARKHGPATDLRLLLEPIFVKYGVNVVFAGHEQYIRARCSAKRHLLLCKRLLRPITRPWIRPFYYHRSRFRHRSCFHAR